MDIFTSLPEALEAFTREAQRICTVCGDHLTAYCSGSQSVTGPMASVFFAVSVFDISKADIAHKAGLLLYTTSYDHTTPEAALQDLADFLSVDYPLPVAPVELLTQAQQEEIVRLLNHPKVSRPEKTQMLLKYRRFTTQRAAKAITRIRKTIEDREAQPLRQLVA
ncbi:MAG: hypothetical protein ACRYFX_09850 [Janthinobacterium lividum]